MRIGTAITLMALTRPADLAEQLATLDILPGGLAVKLHPCCYALQRPISAARLLGTMPDVRRIRVYARASSVHPLIHSRPRTGLEAKFSCEYAVAAAPVDGLPDAASFTDAAVARPQLRAVLDRIEVPAEPGGDDVMAGCTRLVVDHAAGPPTEVALDLPDGHPERPAAASDLAAKVAGCAGDRAAEVAGLDWDSAAALLHRALPGQTGSRRWPAGSARTGPGTAAPGGRAAPARPAR